MSPRKKVYAALKRSFVYGYLACVGMHMLIQDLLGLEKYVLHVQENWIDLPWAIGLGITLICLVLYVAMLHRFSFLDQDETC